MAIDIEPLKGWIGRQETVEDIVAPFPARAMSATLDRDDAPGIGDALPPLWHWCYFQELARTSDLAENGHARLGGFMPPVPLPRRMYAGGRLTFRRPLRIGEAARRVSTIADLTAKEGATGNLVFLVVRHELAGTDGAAIVEEQDIVYREATRRNALPEPRRAARPAVWRREVEASEALLFRHSALSFNAHRIHYDRPYCEKEGYPGIIVNGPLIATLLADLVRRNTDATLAAFRFRAVRPLFAPSRCIVCGTPKGDTVELWAEDSEGAVLMEAQASLGGSS